MPSKAHSVKVEVTRSYQKAWGRVQADAGAPDVPLWCEANGCTNGWKVVVDLEREFNLGVRTVFGGSVTASSYKRITATFTL